MVTSGICGYRSDWNNRVDFISFSFLKFRYRRLIEPFYEYFKYYDLPMTSAFDLVLFSYLKWCLWMSFVISLIVVRVVVLDLITQPANLVP